MKLGGWGACWGAAARGTEEGIRASPAADDSTREPQQPTLRADLCLSADWHFEASEKGAQRGEILLVGADSTSQLD